MPGRDLSYRQVSQCENATCGRCRCRCGGALHGAARGDGDGFYAALAKDDPHYLASKAEKREARNRRRRGAGSQKPKQLTLFTSHRSL
jgi:hypothetical protein